MGQYHKLVNLDKKEIVDPWQLGLFLKQYEHTGCEGSLADAIYLLVMSSPASGGGDWPMTSVSGRWCGDRVVVLGDYTEQVPGYEGDAKSLYSDSESWSDISPEVMEGLSQVWGFKYAVDESSPSKRITRLLVDA